MYGLVIDKVKANKAQGHFYRVFLLPTCLYPRLSPLEPLGVGTHIFILTVQKSGLQTVQIHLYKTDMHVGKD